MSRLRRAKSIEIERFRAFQEEAEQHFELLMNSQRKCGAQGAAVLVQEFLPLVFGLKEAHQRHIWFKFTTNDYIVCLFYMFEPLAIAYLLFPCSYDLLFLIKRQGTEYIVDAVTREGVHKVSMVWVYDRRPANGGDFVNFGQKCVLSDDSVAQELIEYTKAT